MPGLMAKHSRAEIRRAADYAVGTFFGAGFFPKAPGTFASLAAAVVFFLPADLFYPFIWTLIPLYFLVSVPSIRRIESEAGDDPGLIVADEVIGMWIVWSSPFVPREPAWAILGFLLFRYFDIFKPFPISALNARKGALFVLADDVAGGFAALVIMHIFYFGYLVLPFAYYYLTGAKIPQ